MFSAIVLAGTALGAGVGVFQRGSTLRQSASKLDSITKQTVFKAQERRRQADKLVANQRVSYGKRGVGMSGTPSDILEETVEYAKQDIREIFSSGATMTKNLMSQARSKGNQQLLSSTLSGLSFGYQTTSMFSSPTFSNTNKVDGSVGDFETSLSNDTFAYTGDFDDTTPFGGTIA